MTAPASTRAPAPAELRDPAASSGLPELNFVRPLPGFPGLGRYVLVQVDEPADSAAGTEPAEAEACLYELRSLEQPEVRFLTAIPTAFFPDYVIELDAPSCDDLSLTDPVDAVVLVILTVAGDQAVAANLLAPIVINTRTRAAAQMILSGSDWPVRALLG